VGRIALARGDTRTATEAVSEAAELLRGTEHWDEYQFPFGTLEIMRRLAVNGPADAIQGAAKIIERYEVSRGSPRYAWPLVVAASGACLEAARQAGVALDEQLRDEVAALAERLRTITEKLETSGRAQHASRLTFAATDAHVVGLLAAFGGGPGDAAGGRRARSAGHELQIRAAELRAAWDEAAAAWVEVSEPYPLAQSLLHAAEIAVACGDHDGAGESLRRAAGLAARLGAAPLSEQIAILARRARIAIPGAGHHAAPGQDDRAALGLTERELDVLRLVTAGRSNREIAAELFISPKTASVHVSNILGKLGAATRGEAAAKAHALRLFEPA
jgi:DNA-binding CsgD family transcriptional regulator